MIEHVAGDGDARAMEEMWRVLRPGGVLHLTTNVSARAGRGAHGPAGVRHRRRRAGRREGAFFERRYSAETLERRLLGLGWREEAREYVRERRPVHRRFFAARPVSFLAGGLLPVVCVGNFARIAGPGGAAAGRARGGVPAPAPPRREGRRRSFTGAG